MATQIASTPTIKGDEAYKILLESNRKSSNKSKKGAKKLQRIFSQMVK